MQQCSRKQLWCLSHWKIKTGIRASWATASFSSHTLTYSQDTLRIVSRFFDLKEYLLYPSCVDPPPSIYEVEDLPNFIGPEKRPGNFTASNASRIYEMQNAQHFRERARHIFMVDHFQVGWVLRIVPEKKADRSSAEAALAASPLEYQSEWLQYDDKSSYSNTVEMIQGLSDLPVHRENTADCFLLKTWSVDTPAGCRWNLWTLTRTIIKTLKHFCSRKW